MKIYHNPRCRKSRETLALIEDAGITPDLVLYMDGSLEEKEIKALLKKLGIKAEALVRKTESIYKENYKGKTLTEAQWIKALAKHPQLIERPIVVKGRKAILGRPPENVSALLD